MCLQLLLYTFKSPCAYNCYSSPLSLQLCLQLLLYTFKSQCAYNCYFTPLSPRVLTTAAEIIDKNGSLHTMVLYIGTRKCQFNQNGAETFNLESVGIKVIEWIYPESWKTVHLGSTILH